MKLTITTRGGQSVTLSSRVVGLLMDGNHGWWEGNTAHFHTTKQKESFLTALEVAAQSHKEGEAQKGNDNGH